MNIVLLGSEGSMGRRYQAILRYLGIPYQGFDLQDSDPWSAMSASDGIIIATPTNTHASFFAQRRGILGIPVLCEKPLATDLRIVDCMLAIDNPLQMMAQYSYCDWKTSEGETLYNYYHSGTDGLAWDCMVLLGLARGSVCLKNTSPWWRCCLNGRDLTLAEVQESYVWAIQDWLKHPEGDRAWIKKAHQRAAIFPGGIIDVQDLDAMTQRNLGVGPAYLPLGLTERSPLDGSPLGA